MPEGEPHKRAVAREKGTKGRKEVPVRGGRLDAATQRRAIEVETSGSPTRLGHAAQKLKASGKPTRVLVVPQRHMDKAVDAMQRAGATGRVRNLSGTKTLRVPQPKAPPPSHRKTGTPSSRARGRR